MRFAIVESGGKQYRAVEGRTLEVDRLPVDAGKKFDFERVLLMADDDDVLVGMPTVGDILVKATVVDHIKGPKLDRFKYRAKKRIRVRGGHRQQYTRLLVDFIGRSGEERKVEKAEPAPVVVEEASEVEAAPKEKPVLTKAEGKQAKAKKEAAPKEKPAAKKTSAKPATTTKKSTTTKSGRRSAPDSKKK
ncbi:MAG: 50S ribosomal protein L21 [Anaerolineales bacterium]|nr:50S ribosomal protein L21 [Anaerolineales bacterium]